MSDAYKQLLGKTQDTKHVSRLVKETIGGPAKNLSKRGVDSIEEGNNFEVFIGTQNNPIA